VSIDYRTVIIEQSSAMVDTVGNGALDAPVPGCPGWSLADLAIHVGGIQRWATDIVTTGERAAGGLVEPDHPSTAAAFLAGGTGPLVAALDAADPDAPCWNFSGQQLTKRFWPRRQALEVSFHRWDADSAVRADPAPVEAAVAADAIDEFVRMVMGRVVSRTKADLSGLIGDVHLHCTDTLGEWTFEAVDGALRVVDGHAKAAAAVRGPASDLALFLYNRVPADRVELFGDTALVGRWLDLVRF
jgi:uncharacterized protein (TIGR03083 family)